ncbi:MAG: 3-phosphoshikimate 1-carboxyvinyltransferase [Bacteroidia bacterium]
MISVCGSSETKKIIATIRLPASKSISNRLLILQKLFPGKITIRNLSNSDDTRIMQEALKMKSGIVQVKNAGTCMRFLTAYFSCIEKCEVELHGDERMNQRPVKFLVDAMKKLGADISYLKNDGFPPLKVKGKKITGGEISMDASLSSQYISALILVAPTFENGLTIALEGEIYSRSYIEMTFQLMQQFGFEISFSQNEIKVLPHSFTHSPIQKFINFKVEPDWSSAAFWYEIVALNDDAEIFLEGLSEKSLQGDSIISEIMKSFGVETFYQSNGILLKKNHQIIKSSNHQIDLSSVPDLAPVIAVTAAAKNIRTELTGLKNLRIKESDRLSALETELKKCGFNISSKNDSLIVTPNHKPLTTNHKQQTYNDHRLAMAFAPLALIFGKIEIDDPGVVVKSYPDFWEDLKRAGFKLQLNS